MDRRQFIIAMGGTSLSGILISRPAGAALPQAGSVGTQKRQDDNVRQAVIDACNDCMKTGQACQAMCNEMLRHGMTDLADCHARVVDMLTMCEATGRMAVANTASPARIKALAALCADTCRDCERACKPQAAKHPECKACMDDAAECAKACDAYKAA
jgi:Cys-rich four helix bundle protein (predicted Tat secretion target)